MTSPEDDGLEEALRRALSGAASELEPGTDGLDKIRARIGGRQSRPWLVSVLVGLVDRIRHWTWRGHWAWQDSLPRLGALRERRSRRDNFRGWGIGWLRFVTVLGGIAVVAGIALGVQPFRHAILQASDSLKGGGGGSPRGSAGTEGNGTQASSSGSPTVAAVASGSEQASQVRTTASGKTGVPHPTTSSARCVSTVFPVLSGAKPTKTSAAPETSAAAPGTASASSPAPSSSAATPTQPVYTNTNAATCPVAPPTKTPTPTPTSSSSSPDPAPSDVAPTQESSPTWTDPAPTPTPTPTGFSPTGDPTSSHPSDPPSWSWQGRQERRYAGFPDRHRRRR